MAYGKDVRLSRIFEDDGKTIIVALDHGGGMGPVKGLEKIKDVISKVSSGADAILINPGIAQILDGSLFRKMGLIIRLDGPNTIVGEDMDFWEQFSSVETALKLGADAVAVTVVIGSSKELEMLKKLGNVAALCREKGIPLLAEMLLSKNKIENKNVKTIARIGAELGADIIKTYYTGDLQSFKEVIDGCPVPIVILGGKVKSNLEELFESVKDAIEAGASGIAFGRNIWMNENPNAVLESLRKIIHGRHIP